MVWTKTDIRGPTVVKMRFFRSMEGKFRADRI
jgi:hypothetical protein